MTTADRITARLEALYGIDDARQIVASDGVLHVAAVWAAPGERHVVLKIEEATPKSPTDFFVLRLARARADAIVVTGKILRDEPEVRFTLDGPDADALETWRHDVRGRRQAPTVCVLTSGRGLDLTHPGLRDADRVVVFTSDAAASRLGGADDVRVVGHPEPNLRNAVAWLRAHGMPTVSVEAGPSTAGALYAAPLAVDEVMLSVIEHPDLPEPLRGGALPTMTELRSQFARVAGGAPRTEHGRTWRFYRFSGGP